MQEEKRLQNLLNRVKNQELKLQQILKKSISPKKSFVSQKTRQQST